MHLLRKRALPIELIIAAIGCVTACTSDGIVATSGLPGSGPTPPSNEPALAPAASASMPAAPATAQPSLTDPTRLPPGAAGPASPRQVATPTRISGADRDLLGVAQFIAGDLDADGFDDIVLLVKSHDEAEFEQFQLRHPEDWEQLIQSSGLMDLRAYVFYGRAHFPNQLALSDADAVLEGPTRDLVPVGDINGDGCADLAFRAPQFVRIVFGASQRFQGVVDTNAFGVRWDGPVLAESQTYEGLPSISTMTARDLDADGCDDLLVTVANSGSSSAPDLLVPPSAASARVYLVKGHRGAWASGSFDATWAAAEFAPKQVADMATFSTPMVLPAGDLDGDGYADLLAETYVNGLPAQLIFYGGVAALSGMLGAAQANARTIAADPSTEFFSTFASIGDFDGDGASELAYWRPGGLHVFYGRHTRWAGALPLEPDLVILTGLVLGGEIVWATDVDGDALADIVISRTSAGPNLSGALYLLRGTGVRLTGEVNLSEAQIYASSMPENAVSDRRRRDAFGSGMHADGDVNGDGSDDVLVGAPCEGAYPPRGYVTLIPSTPSTPQ